MRTDYDNVSTRRLTSMIHGKKIVFIALFAIITCGCKDKGMPVKSGELLYLGIGTTCSSFNDNIPSFGGVTWSQPMSILVDNEKILSVAKGGASSPIKKYSKDSVIVFHRDNSADELVYVMVFIADPSGATKVLWKRIIDQNENHVNLNLFSGV